MKPVHVQAVVKLAVHSEQRSMTGSHPAALYQDGGLTIQAVQRGAGYIAIRFVQLGDQTQDFLTTKHGLV
jgi:hypothetical protein